MRARAQGHEKTHGGGMISPEPIFSIRCELANILDLGAAPFGHRRVVNMLGGPVTGAKLNGRVLPGGADWQIVAADGSLDLHARYTHRERCGRADPGRTRRACATARRRCWRGSAAARMSIPSLYYFRTVMRFETAHPSDGVAEPHPGAGERRAGEECREAGGV